jgi:hypothetical protein
MNRSGGLAAVHIAAFLITLLLAFALPPVGLLMFAPLVLAQVGLINTWLAFGFGRWQDRAVVWGIALFLATMPLLLVPLALAAVHVGALAVVRRKVAGLYYFLGDPHDMAHRRLQFSLKQLLLVMLTVAVVFALARWLRSLGEQADLGLGVFVLSLTAVVINLLLSHALAIWAVLGTERPALGVLASAAIGGVLGAVLAFAANQGFELYLVAAGVGAMQALIFAASLLTVRGDGYRLFLHPHAAPPPLTTNDEIWFLEEGSAREAPR